MPRLGGALDVVQVGDPATPAAGRQMLYFKSDGILYTKKPDGTVTPIGSGSSSSPVPTLHEEWTVSTTLPTGYSGVGTFAKDSTQTVGNSTRCSANGGNQINITNPNSYAEVWLVEMKLDWATIQTGTRQFINMVTGTDPYNNFIARASADAGEVVVSTGSISVVIPANGTVTIGYYVQSSVASNATVRAKFTLSPEKGDTGPAGPALPSVDNIQIGTVAGAATAARFGALGSITSQPNGGGTFYADNAYWDGINWRYISAAGAELVYLSPTAGVAHYMAGAGAADAVISWISMTGVTTSAFSVVPPVKMSDRGSVPATPTSSSLVYSRGGRAYTMGSNGLEVPIDSILLYRLAAAVTSTSTTPAACISSVVLPAGSTWAFEFNGSYSAAAGTTAITLGNLFSAATGVVIDWTVMFNTSATATWSGASPTVGANLGGATTSGGLTKLPIQMTGSFIIGTSASNFSIAYATTVASSGVTISRGSYLKLTRLT